MAGDNTESTVIGPPSPFVIRQASTFVIGSALTRLSQCLRSSLDDGFGRGGFTREGSFSVGALTCASGFSGGSSRFELDVGVHDGGSLAGKDSSDVSSTMSFLVAMSS